jgi:hypothetical protein
MIPTNRLRLVFSVPSVPATFVRPCGPANQELEWFFTMAECSMGLRSNFSQALVHERQRQDDPDLRFEAARAHRIILGHLQHMGDPDAGVLFAAYAARPWPIELIDELGRLTGIMVRLEAADIGLPDSDRRLVWLEQHVASTMSDALFKGEFGRYDRLRERAQRIFDRAYGAYRRKRGTGPSLVQRFP